MEVLAGVDAHPAADAVVHLAAIPAAGLVPNAEVFRANTLSTYTCSRQRAASGSRTSSEAPPRRARPAVRHAAAVHPGRRALPGPPESATVGPNETLLSIAKTQELLDYEPLQPRRLDTLDRRRDRPGTRLPAEHRSFGHGALHRHRLDARVPARSALDRREHVPDSLWRSGDLDLGPADSRGLLVDPGESCHEGRTVSRPPSLP